MEDLPATIDTLRGQCAPILGDYDYSIIKAQFFHDLFERPQPLQEMMYVLFKKMNLFLIAHLRRRIFSDNKKG